MPIDSPLARSFSALLKTSLRAAFPKSWTSNPSWPAPATT